MIEKVEEREEEEEESCIHSVEFEVEVVEGLLLIVDKAARDGIQELKLMDQGYTSILLPMEVMYPKDYEANRLLLD